jgi:FMN phosphatase YigB (HAD superfamily)
MLDISRVKAISLDLDDTLWPIWPTIERAEKVLHDWLNDHAPMAAALFSSPTALREIRDYMARQPA